MAGRSVQKPPSPVHVMDCLENYVKEMSKIYSTLITKTKLGESSLKVIDEYESLKARFKAYGDMFTYIAKTREWINMAGNKSSAKAGRSVQKPPYAVLVMECLEQYVKKMSPIYTTLVEKRKEHLRTKPTQFGESSQKVIDEYKRLIAKFNTSDDIFDCIEKTKQWINMSKGNNPTRQQKTSHDSADRKSNGDQSLQRDYQALHTAYNKVCEELRKQKSAVEKLQQQLEDLRRKTSEPAKHTEYNALHTAYKNASEELQKEQSHSQLLRQKLEVLRRENSELGEHFSTDYNALRTAYKNASEVLQKEQTHSQQLRQELEVLRRKNSELTEHLLKEVNAKISADEPHLENINIKNRPMTISEEYLNLTSNEWNAAMSDLDYQFKDASKSFKYQFLSYALLVVHAEATQKFEKLRSSILTTLASMLQEPLQDQKYMHGKETQTQERDKPRRTQDDKKNSDISTDGPFNQVWNSIGDFLRGTADGARVSDLIQESTKHLSTKFPKALQSNTGALQIYLHNAALLAWKMVLQRPPMSLETDGIGEMYNSRLQDVFYDSQDPRKHPIAYYVHPILKHGHQVMAKGKVICDKRSTIKK